MEQECRFYKPRLSTQFQAHPYQFNVWKKSSKTRYFIDVVIVLALAIVSHYYFVEFITDSYAIGDLYVGVVRAIENV